MLQTLTDRVDAGLFTTAGVVDGRSVGVFEPSQTASWSANAGALAAATYASYRVLNGAVTLQPAGTVTHAVSDGDGTLQVATLKLGSVKELANDVTVSGEIEPTAYIAETFAGDGTTAVFQLAETPFRVKASASRLLTDSFDKGAFDHRIWTVNDSGSHLGLSGAGLTMTGGNGFDGQTTLTAIDAVETGWIAGDRGWKPCSLGRGAPVWCAGCTQVRRRWRTALRDTTCGRAVGRRLWLRW